MKRLVVVDKNSKFVAFVHQIHLEASFDEQRYEDENSLLEGSYSYAMDAPAPASATTPHSMTHTPGYAPPTCGINRTFYLSTYFLCCD